MKVEVDINKKYEAVSVVIKSPVLNREVTDVMAKLEDQKNATISGKCNDKIYILHPEDIYLFYSMRGKVLVDTKESSFEIKQKLYEVEENHMGKSFVRISK